MNYFCVCVCVCVLVMMCDVWYVRNVHGMRKGVVLFDGW